MKTMSEIGSKINSLMEANTLAKKANRYDLAEQIAGQIDMLLWVIGDRSGLSPLDERINDFI